MGFFCLLILKFRSFHLKFFGNFQILAHCFTHYKYLLNAPRVSIFAFRLCLVEVLKWWGFIFFFFWFNVSCFLLSDACSVFPCILLFPTDFHFLYISLRLVVILLECFNSTFFYFLSTLFYYWQTWWFLIFPYLFLYLYTGVFIPFFRRFYTVWVYFIFSFFSTRISEIYFKAYVERLHSGPLGSKCFVLQKWRFFKATKSCENYWLIEI